MTPPPATSQSPATPKATGDITLAPMAHAPTAVATVATVSRTEPPSLILRKYRRLGPAGGLIDTKHSCPDLLSSAGGHPRDVRVTPATRGLLASGLFEWCFVRGELRGLGLRCRGLRPNPLVLGRATLQAGR
jgi:hypothetical protein